MNTAELRSGGKGLEDAANSIPPPPEQFTTDGTDDLSKALLRLTQEKEAALIEGLPQVKKDSLKTAQDIGVAADRYETTDQEIADTITKRVAEFDAIFHPDRAGGGSGAGSGGQFGDLVSGGGGSPAGSTGSPEGSPEGMPSTASGGSAAGAASPSSGQDPLQMLQQMGQAPMQMMQMPMQMMQQAGQLPQGIMQTVQGGIQQISQMAGEAGKNGDTEKDSESTSEGKDQEPDTKAPAAPAPGAGDGGSTTERAPVAGSSGGGGSESMPAEPKHEAAPVNPAPRRTPTDSSILL
ncbi:hypothetical protein [Mycobacterium syngnathidarum]|uniref:hypothetical protein n=1 Tax=Mycobacterium syngnathidarum TaxID=1908205 RepID=UPI001F601BC9|nr:hypothetical protein [Mycobacterium syngnathidarum]